TLPALEQALHYYVPKSRDMVTQALNGCLQQGTPFDLELEMVSASGRAIWVRCAGEPQRNTAGAVTQAHGAFQDITERKHIEEAMERRLNELKVLFDLLPAMIWFKDTENRILRVNKRVADAAGKSIEEIEGRPSVEIYPQEAAKYFADDLDVIGSGIPKLGIVETLRSPDGDEAWVQTDKVPVFDKDKKVLGVFVMAQDITERKLTENTLRKQAEDLRNSEAQFQALVEGAPEAIFVVTDMFFSYVNAASCRLFEAGSPEQLLGHSVMDRIDPSVHQLVRTRISTVFDKKETAPTIEQLWLTLSGSRIPVEVSSVPITYLGRRSSLTFIRDISERKKSEEAVRRSEVRYRSTLEAAPDAVVIVNGAGEIVLVNTRTEELFGYPRQALLAKSVNLLLPERFRRDYSLLDDAFLPDLAAQFAREPSAWFGLRSDGVEFPIEVNLSLLDADGGAQVFAAIRDVTERNRAQQRSQQLEISAAEAQAANKAKSLFLSSMSHEIRTPMTAIMGYSELVLRDPDLGKSAITKLNVIKRNGQHLLNIINNVLDMAKIEAGHLEIAANNFSVRALLHDLEGTFGLQASAKAIQFETAIVGEHTDCIVADEGKLRQVLLNLLGNAIKFTMRGKISLHVSVSKNAEGLLWFSAAVRDTGIGMTEEEIGKLFQPFAQAQGGQRVHHGGTGLGLAISRGVLNAMGGEISVSSQCGSGSTFNVRIPVERGADQVLTSNFSHRHVLGIKAGQDAPRILIVDDLADTRQWA
ncbi:MAG TPA: PAS domain S-box protein, partial [Steroidobacteraceae bacterium]|nr:PAS domain S-box protein [Steroidobacteraceae bacterium]